MNVFKIRDITTPRNKKGARYHNRNKRYSNKIKSSIRV